VAWAAAASTGIFALSWMWFQRSSRPASPERSRRPGWLSIAYLAELTGGFYLSHVLFINMIRAALYSGPIGGAHLPWPIRTSVFYVGTAVVAVAFVSLVVRTPLRWILGGPVRPEQKKRDNEELVRQSPAGVRAGPFGPLGPFGQLRRTSDTPAPPAPDPDDPAPRRVLTPNDA
jgi:hypothetical protein